MAGNKRAEHYCTECKGRLLFSKFDGGSLLVSCVGRDPAGLGVGRGKEGAVAPSLAMKPRSR